jgi:hypothetical protein
MERGTSGDDETHKHFFMELAGTMERASTFSWNWRGRWNAQALFHRGSISAKILEFRDVC